MDFARKQLEKYGWKEGQGLGRNEDGISNAIKPKLKFDNAGIGHKLGDQFTNRWWETLFNNASKNINIQVDEDSTVNLALKSDPVEITTKSYSVKKKDSNGLYCSFLKTSKLTQNGVEHYNNSAIIHENPKKFSDLTDEELFAACGGRTAHKGARHGLKLNGKLSRIEKQEKLLLKKMRGCSINDEPKLVKKMKKLNLHKQKLTSAEDLNNSIDAVSDSSCASVKKSKKKLRKSVSFNDKVQEYYIPNNLENAQNLAEAQHAEAADSINSDEGIEKDLDEDNNQEGDDNHRSFEEPQFVVSDLSNAERKKLKKKRKHEGKLRATAKFIQNLQQNSCEDDEKMDEILVHKDKCECKKRKLNIAEAKCSENKRYQSKSESPESKMLKKQKKKKYKKHKSDEQKMRSIMMSLDSFCKIDDD